ncbi:hypothetical protein ACQWHW_26825, partial [Salmonella enterica subsp. enterica serovar Infantis]
YLYEYKLFKSKPKLKTIKTTIQQYNIDNIKNINFCFCSPIAPHIKRGRALYTGARGRTFNYLL